MLQDHGRRLRALWSGSLRPEVFYDSRALGATAGVRSSLHAKCAVVDDRQAFASANFTEAAQQRNIEAGVLADDPGLAAWLTSQLADLIPAGGLRRLSC